MPWTSLRDSLGGKPLVLAGPILRKVTPDTVTVWIPMQVSASVELTVADDQGVLVMAGTLETVAVGLNLHIAAVTARLLPGKSRLTDGLPLMDDLIAVTATNAFARPRQLLTGDQIYAADVLDALLMVLIDAGDVLLGWREPIPGIVGGSKFQPPIPACLRALVLSSADRGKLKSTPSFTSVDMQRAAYSGPIGPAGRSLQRTG